MVGLLALLAAGLIAAAGGCSANASRAANTEAGRVAGVWVTARPSSAAPGTSVTVRADCRDGGGTAMAKSDAFGPLALNPGGGALSGTTQVARRTPEGTYDVVLTCPNGARATTRLTVLSLAPSRPSQPSQPTVDPGQATLGPHTGGGYLARNPPPPAPSHGWPGTGVLVAGAVVMIGLAGLLGPRRWRAVAAVMMRLLPVRRRSSPLPVMSGLFPVRQRRSPMTVPPGVAPVRRRGRPGVLGAPAAATPSGPTAPVSRPTAPVARSASPAGSPPRARGHIDHRPPP
jgi:hypothetical protein